MKLSRLPTVNVKTMKNQFNDDEEFTSDQAIEMKNKRTKFQLEKGKSMLIGSASANIKE